jgi:glucose-1-phosphate thymidylyltransferase
MKGIILAGGKGTRLYPLTISTSKQLLGVYDKPMIYYPLTTLIQSGIRDIAIITTPDDSDKFQDLLGDGSKFGCNLNYFIQPKAEGLAQAYTITEEFIKGDSSCLILGDNLFVDETLPKKIKKWNHQATGGLIFGYQVSDPERYGVVDFDNDMNVISIEEKPSKPKSNYAIPGIYVYDKDVIEAAKMVKPSQRGELEITSIHNQYLDSGKLKVEIMEKGSAWLDTGTFTSLMQAGQYVQVIEERQGIKIGCPEEAAFRQGFINKEKLSKTAQSLIKSGYGEYLLNLIKK